ncbi:MAG: hypothetical protein C0484_08120 [Rhodospirillum sp.]|nr:hypothetical protein [Rhodospirillum sp.]
MARWHQFERFSRTRLMQYERGEITKDGEAFGDSLLSQSRKLKAIPGFMWMILGSACPNGF